jgi:hypothetical protein
VTAQRRTILAAHDLGAERRRRRRRRRREEEEITT